MTDAANGVRVKFESVPDDYEGATPLLKQYFATRKEHPGIIVLIRVGDFFEAYGQDAETLASELQITLTGREDGGIRVPMAGVPHQAVERYIARLIAQGHRVALMDQVEDPRFAKGLVKRRVTRVVTPGTVLEDTMLESSSNNYLLAAVVGDPVAGISILDVSTGEFLTTEIEGERRSSLTLDEIARLEPAEILVADTTSSEWLEAIKSMCNAPITLSNNLETSRKDSRSMLLEHFQTQSLRGFGCEEYSAGLDACALLLRYVKQNQEQALQHIRSLSTYSIRDFMTLDAAARRHLEIITPMGEGGKNRTLLGALDETLTPMGGRMLRRWLEEPLLDTAKISYRHDAVEELSKSTMLRGDIRELLHGMGDIERLVSRSAAGLANARDLVALKSALERLPAISAALDATGSPLLKDIRHRLAVPPEIATRIARAITDEPPAGLRDGGMIRQGYNDELDRLKSMAATGRAYIANLETTEREATAISSLKVGFNNVFGYYIEITKTHIDKVPANYIRKQTTANSERYITPELKEFEASVLNADEKAVELEYELFIGLRERVALSSSECLSVARATAELDLICSFAETAARHSYTRPEIHDENRLEIRGGRHPVIERLSPSYIPNDCTLDELTRLIIITGPNMSGKSSYLRQTALIVLMAQIGSFVPADSASIGVVDRIFTRVGAHDELASGQSTFMVEMNETANILNNAGPRSLVVLDEIGRGTSTYDGLSIAWSVAEYLAKIGCKTLFATHYHHLNELENQMPVVKNYRVSVKERGDQIIWLRKLVPGGTDKSYGIQVARMAGIPSEVLDRAFQVLKSLEKSSAGAGKQLAAADSMEPIRKKKIQLTLFEQEEHPVLEQLRTLELSALTPVEALMKLDQWQRELKQEKK